MRNSKTSHLAIYGNTVLKREYCRECETYSLVIDGYRQCCDRLADTPIPDHYKRISIPEQMRKPLSTAEQRAQLELQQNRCFYCDHEFGSTVWRNGKTMRLRIHWDHQIPYALTQNNQGQNYVAACHVCNAIKHDYVFQTPEEAKVFILGRRNEKGYV